jgi:hypothetical protein
MVILNFIIVFIKNDIFLFFNMIFLRLLHCSRALGHGMTPEHTSTRSADPVLASTLLETGAVEPVFRA